MTVLPFDRAARPLSHRQAQIADGIRRGLTYAEIAGELARKNERYISPFTVRTHVVTMAGKLRSLVLFQPDEHPDQFKARKVIEKWLEQQAAQQTEWEHATG